MMVQRKDIAEILSPGVNSTVLQHLRGLNADSMRTVQVNDDVMYAVKAALRGTLDEHGLTYRGGFITWSQYCCRATNATTT